MKTLLNLHKYLRGVCVLCIFAMLCVTNAMAASANFVDSVKQTAKAENKSILLIFSGIQWCPPCQMFDAQVLKNPQFKQFAKDNLVIVDIDRKRSGDFEISINAKPQTGIDADKLAIELNQKFGIRGVPTSILLDKNFGELFRKVGSGISANDFVEKIKSATKSK